MTLEPSKTAPNIVLQRTSRRWRAAAEAGTLGAIAICLALVLAAVRCESHSMHKGDENVEVTILNRTSFRLDDVDIRWRDIGDVTPAGPHVAVGPLRVGESRTVRFALRSPGRPMMLIRAGDCPAWVEGPILFGEVGYEAFVESTHTELSVTTERPCYEQISVRHAFRVSRGA